MTVSIPQWCAELRADMIERADAPEHVRFLEGMIRSARGVGDRLFPPEYAGVDVAADIRASMVMAEMWTGTPDMLGLIMHAAKSLPPETLVREQVPSPHGFLYLPLPLPLTDVSGETIPIHAILWRETTIGRRGEKAGPNLPDETRGLVLFLFTQMGAPEDRYFHGLRPEVAARLRAELPQLSLTHSMSVAFGQMAWDIDTSDIEGTPQERAKTARSIMRSMHDVVSYEHSEETGVWSVVTGTGHVVHAVPDVTVQFLKAYFHFVGSELSALDREYLPRSSARWLRRLGLVNSPITVVRLRRRESGRETGNGWQLAYRHVRRGHWRRQWCGSERDGSRRQEHRWIAPTIVGPEGAELRVRDVVNMAQW